MATLKNTIINDTGYLTLPTGTIAQRPGVPTNGMIRYNTENNLPEIYYQGSWKSLGITPISASGGVITTSSDYKIHTFTSSATFVIHRTGSEDNFIQTLIVAGGGGGGPSRGGSIGAGGGGGAGAYYEDFISPSTTGITYTITVGGGGAFGTGLAPSGSQGSPTIVSASNGEFYYYASGGGGGGTPFTSFGGMGGSGGGAGNDGDSSNTFRNPGENLLALVSGSRTNIDAQTFPYLGRNGGRSYTNNASTAKQAGGGGGASSEGQNGGWIGGVDVTGSGGNGTINRISGTATYYAGGGGGGGTTTSGNGGLGGGGKGSFSTTVGVNGTANTGGGGGGGGGNGSVVNGGNGGSGIVILRYRYQ